MIEALQNFHPKKHFKGGGDLNVVTFALILEELRPWCESFGKISEV